MVIFFYSEQDKLSFSSENWNGVEEIHILQKQGDGALLYAFMRGARLKRLQFFQKPYLVRFYSLSNRIDHGSNYGLNRSPNFVDNLIYLPGDAEDFFVFEGAIPKGKIFRDLLYIALAQSFQLKNLPSCTYDFSNIGQWSLKIGSLRLGMTMNEVCNILGSFPQIITDGVYKFYHLPTHKYSDGTLNYYQSIQLKFEGEIFKGLTAGLDCYKSRKYAPDIGSSVWFANELEKYPKLCSKRGLFLKSVLEESLLLNMRDFTKTLYLFWNDNEWFEILDNLQVPIKQQLKKINYFDNYLGLVLESLINEPKKMELQQILKQHLTELLNKTAMIEEDKYHLLTNITPAECFKGLKMLNQKELNDSSLWTLLSNHPWSVIKEYLKNENKSH